MEKKIKVLIFFSIFLISWNIHAQADVDSISYYYQNFGLEKGISFAETLKKGYEQEKNIQSPDYALILNNLGIFYLNANNYSKAEPLLLQETELVKKIFGPTHPLLRNSYYNLANLYYNTGDFEESEKFHKLAMENIKFNFSDEHPDYLKNLLDLALLYANYDHNEKAEYLYQEAEKLIKYNDAKNILIKIKTYQAIGLFYYKINNLTKANIYFQKIGVVVKKIDLDSIPSNSLIDMLVRLGQINLSMLGNHIEAEKYFLEALNILNSQNKQNSEAYILAIENLGVISQLKGQNYRAEQYFIQTLESKMVFYNKSDPEVLNTLSLLGNLFFEQGDYKGAEKNYLKAIKLQEESGEFINKFYFESLADLSNFYIKLGSYNKSFSILSKGESLFKNYDFKYEIYKFSFLKAWANYYSAIQDFEKAKNIIERLIIIENNNPGASQNHFNKSQLSLASIYFATGKVNEAEKIYLEYLKDQTYNPSINISVLKDLGQIYYLKKDYSQAENFFHQAYRLAEQNFGINHPLTQDVIFNFAVFYDSQSQKNKASFYLKEILKHSNSQLTDLIPILSIEELISYRKSKTESHFFPLSFLHRFPNEYDSIRIGAYENELLVNNLSLRNNQLLKDRIHQNGDTSLLSKYDTFIENKKNLTRLASLPVEKKPKNYSQLVVQTETLEKELVRLSSAFSEAKNTLSTDWKNVQENLETNEVVIQLMAFDYYNQKWTDSIVYSAFVVKKGFKAPKYISLFEEKQLEKIISNSGHSKNKVQLENLYTEKNLSNLFLKPLHQELEGVKTIFLSPAGLGHQIDFSALKVTDSSTLGEAYNLHIIGSSAEITNYKISTLNNKTEILLYGDVDYDRSNAKNNHNPTYFQEELLTELATRSGTDYWGYLPGTKQEVEQINSTAKNNKFVSSIIYGEKATEESIKQLDGRTNPFVLHLATHGFFFSNPKKTLPNNDVPLFFEDDLGNTAPVYKTSEDPMMRSGLLFAGANHHWGKQLENVKGDDGILTAREIANLDLSACELVVLSACDTGLGEIKGSDGVYGLQRAFKMAGVKNIIMSLWKVPDAQTAELFDLFYKEALNGKTIHESFKLAQARMSEKYSPFYWAGFVLLQ